MTDRHYIPSFLTVEQANALYKAMDKAMDEHFPKQESKEKLELHYGLSYTNYVQVHNFSPNCIVRPHFDPSGMCVPMIVVGQERTFKVGGKISGVQHLFDEEILLQHGSLLIFEGGRTAHSMRPTSEDLLFNPNGFDSRISILFRYTTPEMRTNGCGRKKNKKLDKQQYQKAVSDFQSPVLNMTSETGAGVIPQVSTGVTVTLNPQELELKQLYQSTTRDTLALGKLLIAMRSEHPRGEWTSYLEGLAVRTDISRSSLFRYIAAIEKPEKTKKAVPDFRTVKLPDGQDMGTLQSWLQKSIRRGDETNAMYAAAQFSLTGFDGAVFNTCFTTASEDIGIAERGLVQELLALHAAYKIERSRKSQHGHERLQLKHAVLLCCRAAKSRLVDHALIVAFEGSETQTPPEWVFDIHTQKGKAEGKTVADFFDVENAGMSSKASAIDDPYQKQPKQIRAARSSAKNQATIAAKSASPQNG